MFKLKALLVASLFVVAANTNAMQQENVNPNLDIIDNSSPTSDHAAIQAANLAQLTARNARRKPMIKRGLQEVATSDEAYRLQKIATNSCSQKAAHKAHKLGVQFEDEEAGWHPNMPGRNILLNYNSDSDSD